MNTPVSSYKNRILAALPKAEINRLAPHLSPVNLKQEQTLLDGKAKYAYFLEEGIASVVATVEDGTTVEIGVIGFDGIVGIPILLGAGSAPGRTFIQIAGSGFRIESAVLKRNLSARASCGNICRNMYRHFWYRLLRQPFVTVCIASKKDSHDGC